MSIRCSRQRGLTRSALNPLLLVLLGLLVLTGNAFAASLNLAWDSVSGATGYRVAYGTASGNYSANLDAGNKTSTAVSGLTEGTRYYFAVRAYNATTTSPYSNEVNTVVPTTPVASFTANGSTASSLSVTQGQTVTFVDTSTGTVASRSWALGDGTTPQPTAQTVVTSYSTTGTKMVTLSVTGAGVTNSASKTINVTATTAPPVAAFSATPLSGTAPLTVQFTDASSGSITGWSWNFGNGATNSTKNPSYTYSTAGTYTVALTVTGSGGSNTATKSSFITVEPPPSGGGTVSKAGLVAAYGFEETSGTQAQDASGKGNHGALTNVTRTSSGKFGRALSFNGSNSLVTVNDSASLDLTNAMTLSTWVYPAASPSRWRSLILKEQSGGLTYALYADCSAEQPCSYLYIGGAERGLAGGSNLPSNTWTHLAATYDGATQRLYVNGTEVGSRSQSGTLAVSANPLRIGGNTVWGEYFQGLIDEVRVYSRALSQTEVAAVSQEPVVIEPRPWLSTDIGGVGRAGSAAYAHGTYTLQGSGSDIWGTADAFHFAYQPLNSDGTITARVASVEDTHAWAKAGVMIRESLDADARHAMVVVTPGNGVAFQSRSTTGGSSSHTPGAAVPAPYWVRLTRSGSRFTAYQSVNGTTWAQVGSATISMATSAYVGLALTSHNNTVLNTATLDSVSIQ